MAIDFVPTQSDVSQYLRWRAASNRLGPKICKHIPPEAVEEIGQTLGLLRDGFLIVDNPQINGVLTDCCLYDWYDDEGLNVMERYAEEHWPTPGTEEALMLHAFLNAEYRLLSLRQLVLGVGARCDDVMTHEKIFLMDVNLSKTLGEGVVMATRTVPLGDFFMTNGAALPFTDTAIIDQIQREVSRKAEVTRTEFTLSVVRACLDSHADEYIRPRDLNRREPRHLTRRNRRKSR